MKIAVTVGEPAGIGPDILLALAAKQPNWPLVAVADPVLLKERADQLGLKVPLLSYTPRLDCNQVGLAVLNVGLIRPVRCGQLDPANVPYVLQCLDTAVARCLSHEFYGLVTGPVHKSVINQAGIPFSGHTEYLAELTHAVHVVMLLAGPRCKVALVTTHLPLSRVAAVINESLLGKTIIVLSQGLQRQFAVKQPRILVCGLNPHAGEGGYLGDEEERVIKPVLENLRAQGYHLIGPVSADTAFTPDSLARADAVLAMYHDQGLAPFKALNFHQAVNITLGLPILRTSVDHGTALELAGTGKADASSLEAAVRMLVAGRF